MAETERRCERRKGRKRHTCWALVESARTARGARQRVVAYLGELAARQENGWATLARRLALQERPRPTLFDPPRHDAPADDEPVRVSLKGVRLQRLRDFGDVGLAWGLWRCVQVCIGLAVTTDGIPLGYEAFDGNTNDSTTVEEIVEAMEAKCGRADRVRVMDRRMVSEASLVETDPAGLWKRYIQLTEAERAFRIAKDELAIRPVWRHTADRVKGHILVRFLAYAMWKTLAQWMRGDAPRTVLEAFARIKSGGAVPATRTADGRPGTTSYSTGPLAGSGCC